MKTTFDKADLLEILSYPRAARSWQESDFINDYLLPNIAHEYEADRYGNIIVKIGEPTILFSCHIDTCERASDIEKRDILDLGATIRTGSNQILGADDGAGMFILLSMIEAGIEGLYIFHRDEEIGGLGSSYIAEATPELLTGIKHAIAFDRKGTHDVVVVQLGTKMASAASAGWLCAQLDLQGGKGFTPAVGSFTDTANYFGIVPECFNISVGYGNEHTQNEYLDWTYLNWLQDAVLSIDWKKLPSGIVNRPRPQTLADIY
jgi:acetylornithine deacetylase/succinyl-diaminopimelate desuccinylase-like protein